VDTGQWCVCVRCAASRNQLYLHSHSDNVDKILTLIGSPRVRRCWWYAVGAGRCPGIQWVAVGFKEPCRCPPVLCTFMGLCVSLSDPGEILSSADHQAFPRGGGQE